MAAKKAARVATYTKREAFAKMAADDVVMVDEDGDCWRYHSAHGLVFLGRNPLDHADVVNDGAWAMVNGPFSVYSPPPEPLTDEKIAAHFERESREARSTGARGAYLIAARIVRTRQL